MLLPCFYDALSAERVQQCEYLILNYRDAVRTALSFSGYDENCLTADSMSLPKPVFRPEFCICSGRIGIAQIEGAIRTEMNFVERAEKFSLSHSGTR